MKANPLVSGILFTAAPLPFAVGSWTHGAVVFEHSLPLLTLALCTSLFFTLAGISLSRHFQWTRFFTIMALLGWGLLISKALVKSPSATLSFIFVAIFVLASLRDLFPFLKIPYHTHSVARSSYQIRGASAFLLAYGLVALFQEWSEVTSISTTASIGSLAVLTILIVSWLRHKLTYHPVRSVTILVTIFICIIALWTSWPNSKQAFTFGLMIPLIGLCAIPTQSRASGNVGGFDIFLTHPERLFVSTFLLLSIVGALLLILPFSSATTDPIQIMDAAFTSISAVCVTGLTVVDTSQSFSLFGQAVILVLIQVGGLGILTFSTIGLKLLGSRLSLRYEGTYSRIVSPQDRSRVYETALQVVKLTFVAELIGAMILSLLFFIEGDAISMAVWRGVFTAISAFCNAGFSLQTLSLEPYAHNPAIIHTIGTLIILGGLSPLVVFSIPHIVRRQFHPIPLQVKIALIATFTLLMVGFFVILALEWKTTLGQMSPWDRIHNAWFHSIALRTAGFNSFDIYNMRSPTLFFMMLWMFIGGNPGGTAGGIKTTTIAVVGLAASAALQGHGTITIFGRHISSRAVYRAIAIVLGASGILLASFLALQLTQTLLLRELIFEVVSALGNVGLSLGATSQLDAVGKSIIMVCMFVGRVGPLTFFMVLRRRQQMRLWRYPEEDVAVG